MKKSISILMISFWVLLSCQLVASPQITQPPAADLPSSTNTVSPLPLTTKTTPPPTEAPPVLPTIVPSSTATPPPITRMGPEEFPPGYNPLSGLKVEDPENLTYPPIMVSVSNFPPAARPQAGLDWCPSVYEGYIGDGETRFLATFYGDYPKLGGRAAASLPMDNGGFVPVSFPAQEATPGTPADDLPVLSDHPTLKAPGIGPIRSARIWYGEAAKLHQATLAFAHAWPGVLAKLPQNYITVNPLDDSDINSGFLDVTKLQTHAMNLPNRLQPTDLAGNLFDLNPPEASASGWESGSAIMPVSWREDTLSQSSWIGKPADTVWIPWSNLSQIFWRYDEESGAYHRYQDQADAKTFVQAIDRLSGRPLTFENLIILFANHTILYPNAQGKSYVYEIELLYVQKFPAILFRDGKMYNIYWTTISGEYERKTGRARPIRYIDGAGNPFPLKPGQTWVTIMPPGVRLDIKEVKPFNFESKRAVRKITVEFGDAAPAGMKTTEYQQDVFYLDEMGSRYPMRYKNKQEGSGTWMIPFAESYILP